MGSGRGGEGGGYDARWRSSLEASHICNTRPQRQEGGDSLVVILLGRGKHSLQKEGKKIQESNKAYGNQTVTKSIAYERGVFSVSDCLLKVKS